MRIAKCWKCGGDERVDSVKDYTATTCFTCWAAFKALEKNHWNALWSSGNVFDPNELILPDFTDTYSIEPLFHGKSTEISNKRMQEILEEFNF